jgi:FMN phosphatase YigB (HAD superfamily)
MSLSRSNLNATDNLIRPMKAANARPGKGERMRIAMQKHRGRSNSLEMASLAGYRSRTAPEEIVFLLDVDNTLLDNDRFEADLDQRLTREFGSGNRDLYWTFFEELRAEHGYADYLGALQRYRSTDVCSPGLLRLSLFLVNYPFAERLYPGALDVIQYLQHWGPTVILSDGDAVFQPHKLHSSGLWDAVKQQVLICIHKEQMLEAVIRSYPARRYLMVDDKPHILKAMKDILGNRLTTVFARQGHYALDPHTTDAYPHADITLDRIGDLLHCEISAVSGSAAAGATK